MKKQYLKTVILAAALAGPLNAMGQVATPTHTIQQTFTIPSPDYKLSPYTGMTRQSWIDAAEYLLSGAFTYIRTLDDPMYFPKQLDKAYPNNEGQVPTAKLEGFCRTLFVAAPLLREKLLPGIIKGIEQPALLRCLGAQLLQLTPAQLQHLCALHPPAIQQRCKALHIVLPLQSLQKLLLPGEIVSRGPFLQPAQQQHVHLPDLFFIHGSAPCFGGFLFYYATTAAA